MVPQELSKSDVVKIIDQLDKLLPPFSLDFTLQKACCAPLLPSLTLTNGHFHEDSTSCFSFMLATSV
ncbi:MAG: hypothetical protein DRP27_08495 [Thermotogae bacterium]|nr:MAG: hypothetical protein DRP27_08495 [Thermotogota bacterium]